MGPCFTWVHQGLSPKTGGGGMSTWALRRRLNMLELTGIDGYYADLQVLRQVSLLVNSGEVVALFGPNGHGKSTLLKTICGLHQAAAGSIKFEGQEISSFPSHKIV